MAHLFNHKKMEHFDDWDLISIALGLVGGSINYFLNIDVPIVHAGLFGSMVVAFLLGGAGYGGKLIVAWATKKIQKWISQKRG